MQNWLSMKVELLGRVGHELWPWPGRVFAVGPAHTFRDLAEAIDEGFARWERSGTWSFWLPRGEALEDLPSALPNLEGVVAPGDEFVYSYDGWVHWITVEQERVNPVDLFGEEPSLPRVHRGWGVLPDPFGRRWEDDDGVGDPPSRPAEADEMFRIGLPPRVDRQEADVAIRLGDPERFLAGVAGHEIGDDELQWIGLGVTMALASGAREAEGLARSLVGRLRQRDWRGDGVLAEDLEALLDGEPLPGRAVAVDLEMFADDLEIDRDTSSGVRLDLHTGECRPEFWDLSYDEDADEDPDDDPDRWEYFDGTDSGSAWQDMEQFAQAQPDPDLRRSLEQAIEGRGAFRRFRDLVYADEPLNERWQRFSADRTLARARQLLADTGIRVAWRPPS